jgi:hypothetical protein
MKGVLIGSDFLKLADGIKFLEINTDVDITIKNSEFLELNNLFNYLTTNGYTKLVLIYKRKHIAGVVVNLFETAANTNSITFEKIVIPNNSITIPSITSESNTFYLRCAYDVTAIIDDTYCRDKSEMASLLFKTNNENILPKTYVKNSQTEIIYDNFDTIIDNEIHPNVISKKILPDFDKTTYPKFNKFETASQLSDLKAINDGSTLIQEYRFNNNGLVDGKITDCIRTWSILLEDVETMIDLGGYVTSNQLNLAEIDITYTSNILDNKWRWAYFSNPLLISVGIPGQYEVIKIVDGEEVVVNIESLDIGNTIKSVSLLGLNKDELSSESINWESSASLSNLMSYTTASVVGKLSTTFEGWLPTMHYVSGSELGSLITTHKEKLLIKENDTFKFKFVDDITNTDLLVISNEKIVEMTSIHLEWYSGSITTINIEPDDVFLAGTNLNEIGTNSLGSVITHNFPSSGKL